jgi:hypothetical protein
MEERRSGGDEVAIRVMVLFVPIVLTARLLGLWVTRPVAWAVSMLAWMLAIYWLPTRTNLSLRRWLIIVSAAVVLTFLIAILQPDLF